MRLVMDEVHHVDALKMTARYLEGRLAYHIGMMEQMQQHELDHSITGRGEKNLSRWKLKS